MNFLITGGTGLIGKALINNLSFKASTITVLTRDIKKAEKSFLNSNIKFINALSIEHIENQDIVINLAGESIADKRWSNSQKQKICRSRWDITEQLVSLIQEAKNSPSLFISGSAIGIYGRQKNKRIDESFSDYHKEFTHDVCSTWETIANQAKSDNTRVAILRTGIVLACKGGALGKMLLPFKLGLGGKIGNGSQFMSWVHIDDMVAAIIHIINTSDLKGAINITSTTPVTNKEFVTQLAQTLNRPCFINTPASFFKLIMGEMSDLIIYGQNVVPNKLMQSGFKFTYPTLELALKEILN